MIFSRASIAGAYVVDLDPVHDERGFFARAFCEQEFEQHGLASRFPQCNVSFNRRRHTLRGLHYAVPPHREAKLVRCTRGAIFDVIVDLRRDSPTCFRWFGIELSERTRRMLYVPEGVAHGFLTLQPSTEVFYQMGAAYAPEAARGIRWDDPRFGIEWPHRPTLMSERDRTLPDFTGEALTW